MHEYGETGYIKKKHNVEKSFLFKSKNTYEYNKFMVITLKFSNNASLKRILKNKKRLRSNYIISAGICIFPCKVNNEMRDTILKVLFLLE